jgi:hypothetical protein
MHKGRRMQWLQFECGPPLRQTAQAQTIGAQKQRRLQARNTFAVGLLPDWDQGLGLIDRSGVDPHRVLTDRPMLDALTYEPPGG